MSSVSGSGLEQLCAAACNNDLEQPPQPEPAAAEEIKVREIEAFASVADLIHAAILANNGAASLKEIYEVCEQHGRIAYRRADGSRLITSNDHWKSQVRHALYTGGRFERVPSNGEYWQLAQAFRNVRAELVKVLVRADDKTQHIRATLALQPSSGRAILPKLTSGGGGGDTGTGGTARQRRKRALVEDMTDSIDPAAGQPNGRANGLRGRQTRAIDASDNHSTQDEGFDDLSKPRAKRSHRKPTWRAGDDELEYEGGGDFAHPSSYVMARHNSNGRSSADPSTLRWGSTALRSTIIISTGDSSGLSAGKTPLLNRRTLGGGQKIRDTSAEADSVPKYHNPWKGNDEYYNSGRLPPANKRQATRGGALPTPPARPEPSAQLTPPFMTNWMEMVQQQIEEAAKAGVWPPAPPPPAPAAANGGAFPPGMAMLPAMLPGLLAAAAPYFSQQQQHLPGMMFGGSAPQMPHHNGMLHHPAANNHEEQQQQ